MIRDLRRRRWDTVFRDLRRGWCAAFRGLTRLLEFLCVRLNLTDCSLLLNFVIDVNCHKVIPGFVAVRQHEPSFDVFTCRKGCLAEAK